MQAPGSTCAIRRPLWPPHHQRGFIFLTNGVPSRMDHRWRRYVIGSLPSPTDRLPARWMDCCREDSLSAHVRTVPHRHTPQDGPAPGQPGGSTPAQQDPRRIELPAHLGKGLPKRRGPARRQGSRQSLAGQRPCPFRHHQLQLASSHLPTP